jgi:hypothetical protein
VPVPVLVGELLALVLVVGELLDELEAVAVGEPLALVEAVALGEVVAVAPQATPLIAKLVGAVSLVVQVPWKPSPALAPGAMLPL